MADKEILDRIERVRTTEEALAIYADIAKLEPMRRADRLADVLLAIMKKRNIPTLSGGAL